jgi:hypothetical protein
MTPFKEKGHYIIFKLLYNRKHKHSHYIVKNVFKILKKQFKEVFTKSSLHIFLFLMLSLFVVYYMIYYDHILKLM